MSNPRTIGLFVAFLCLTVATGLGGCRDKEAAEERKGVVLQEGTMVGVDYQWRGMHSDFEGTVKQVEAAYRKINRHGDVAVFRGKGLGIVVVGPEWAALFRDKGSFPAAILYVTGEDEAVDWVLDLWSGKTTNGPTRTSQPATEASGE